MHDQSRFLKTGTDIGEDLFADVMLFQQMAELQERCRIRNLFLIKIKMHEGSHGIAVIDRIFHCCIRKIEPALHEVHAEHGLDSSCRPAAFPGWIVGLDQSDPVFPGDHLIHRIKELLTAGFLLPSGVFNINESLLLHRVAPPFLILLFYNSGALLSLEMLD